MKVRAHLTAIAKIGVIAASAVLASAGVALAQLGQPAPWQMDLQEAATPVMAQIAGR